MIPRWKAALPSPSRRERRVHLGRGHLARWPETSSRVDVFRFDGFLIAEHDSPRPQTRPVRTGSESQRGRRSYAVRMSGSLLSPQEIRTADEGVRRAGARVQRRGGGHRPGTSRPGKRRLGRRVWQAWTSLSRRLDLARRHRGGRPSERTGHQVAVLARRGPQLSDLAAQHSAFWSLVAAKSASGYSREVVTPI
jgi:hypothetical protein